VAFLAVLWESETCGFNFAPDAVGAVVTAFADNTITLNTLGAGRLEARHAGLLGGTSSFTGNDVDVVFVGGEGPTQTLADVTWLHLGTGRRCDGRRRVGTRQSLLSGDEGGPRQRNGDGLQPGECLYRRAVEQPIHRRQAGER